MRKQLRLCVPRRLQVINNTSTYSEPSKRGDCLRLPWMIGRISCEWQTTVYAIFKHSNQTIVSLCSCLTKKGSPLHSWIYKPYIQCIEPLTRLWWGHYHCVCSVCSLMSTLKILLRWTYFWKNKNNIVSPPLFLQYLLSLIANHTWLFLRSSIHYFIHLLPVLQYFLPLYASTALCLHALLYPSYYNVSVSVRIIFKLDYYLLLHPTLTAHVVGLPSANQRF